MFAAPGAFDHLWSLAVEEQFYIVWPLVAVVAWRNGGRRRLQQVALGGALATAIWQVLLSTRPGTSIERLYVGTDTRAPAFLLGAVAGLAVLRREWNVTAARRVLVPACMGLAAVCVWLDGTSLVTFRGPLLAVGVLGALAAAAAAHLDGNGRVDRWFIAAPLVTVGRWSYGIYLFHWPLVVLLRDQGVPAVVLFAEVAVLSTVLAGISYRWYERPIRDGSFPTPQARPAVRAAYVSLAVGVLAVSGTVAVASAQVPKPEIDAAREAVLRAPLPSRPAPQTIVAADDVTPPVTATVAGAGPGASGDRLASDAARQAKLGDEAAAAPVAETTRLLVVGDSVAYGLIDQLVALGAERGVEVAVRAAPGCTLSAEARDQNNLFSKDLCAYLWANLRADVLTFRPDRVVLMFGGTWSPLLWHGERLDPCTADGGAALLDAGRRFLDDVEVTGAPVSIAQPPRMAGEYEEAGAAAGTCYAEAYAALAAAAPNRELLALDREVCPTSSASCPAAVHGVELRGDGLHYTPQGGEVVVAWMLDQLL
jgi:hypothetical protein